MRYIFWIVCGLVLLRLVFEAVSSMDPHDHSYRPRERGDERYHPK
jgi:hypothetical protein